MTRPRWALVLAVAAAVVVSGAACGGETPSPVAPDADRPNATEFWRPAAAAPPAVPGPAGAGTAMTAREVVAGLPPFVRTDDSDAWVAQSFVLQPAYTRALLVGSGPPLTEVEVPPPSLAPSPGSPVKVKVAATFATIGEAIAEAKGGDLVAVRPGRYAGFVVAHDATMRDGAYVVVKALGAPGEVIIDRGAVADPDWMILVKAGHHLVIDGFALRGSVDGKGPRAGIMLDGDFRHTTALTHHVAIRNVWSDGHREWGIHATDTRTVLVEDSFFSRSQEEHGVYVSDGSDDWTIRRNVFFANIAGGLQANVDPVASFDEVKEHPAFADHPRWQDTRAWAEGVIRRGNELWGEHAWPDGRGENFLVERNVMNGNGKIGGAAINLAAVSRSLFQNNLVYGNAAGGIAMWDNANPFDYEATEQWPKTAAEAAGARIPLFGCKDNRVRNNTVIMDVRRAALQCRNGSTGCALWNNLAVNGTGPGLEVFGTSVPGLDVRGNVLGRVDFTQSTPALLPLAKTLPAAASQTGVELRSALADLESPATNVPWIRVDGAWPAPAPGRPDLRPKRGTALATAADAASQPPVDLEGRARSGAAAVGALIPR